MVKTASEAGGGGSGGGMKRMVRIPGRLKAKPKPGKRPGGYRMAPPKKRSK